MENLYIKGNLKNPTLNFDYGKGIIEIKGRSWPEHVLQVYEPAFSWLDAYAKTPKESTLVRVMLEYFNTSSSKVVLDLLRKIDAMHKSGAQVTIEWYYESDDPDLKEQGELMKELIKTPIQLKEVEELPSEN